MPTASRPRDYIADTTFLENELYEEDNENVSAERSSAIQSGWEAALRPSSGSGGSYINDFRFDTKSQLVKFFDSAPLAVYDQHWIERNGKRSWVCLQDSSCPICKIVDENGKQKHPAKRKIAFGIVNLSHPDGPTVEMMTVAARTAQILKRYNDDPATGPLDTLYYSVSKAGERQNTVYNFLPIKKRYLEEDYGMDPDQTEALIASLEAPTKKAIPSNTLEQLEEIAVEINGRPSR